MSTTDEINKAFDLATPAASPVPPAQWEGRAGRGPGIARNPVRRTQHDRRNALTIMVALGGGYVVVTTREHEGTAMQFLFAGTLQRCLAYMHDNIVHDADVTAALAELPPGPADG